MYLRAFENVLLPIYLDLVVGFFQSLSSLKIFKKVGLKLVKKISFY